MNALKARKIGNSQVCVSSVRTTRVISQTKIPAFPDNFLVVGAGDEDGTYILVIVFGDRKLAA
jgi:hypothetical protein